MSPLYDVRGSILYPVNKQYVIINGTTYEISKSYNVENSLTKLIYQNITEASSAIVTLDNTNLIYNGTEQTKRVTSVTFEGKALIEGTDYTVSGNTATNAGTYILTINFIGNYEGSVNTAWNIAKLSLIKPSVNGSFTYNGNSQSCTINNMNSTYIEQSGTTTAIAAGTYTVTFSLKDKNNTRWNDNTNTNITSTWSIAKATGSISISPTSLTISGAKGATATATISYIGDGSISVASNATSVATVSRSGNIVTVTSMATGSATITITMAASTNYTGASCTISVNVNTTIFGSYSGTYTRLDDVTISGTKHLLYRLTGSGTLVLYDSAKYWMCAGGANGFVAEYGTAEDEYGYARSMVKGGYGGGGGYINTGTVASGSWTVSIGSAGGASTLSKGSTIYEAAASTQDGASGGGAPAAMRVDKTGYGMATITHPNGEGSGSATYPFGLTSLFAHCAGGAGGGAHLLIRDENGNYSTYWRKGGTGGSNGNAGSIASSATISTAGQTVSGGVKGGGEGGRPTSIDVNTGGDATFYGSGGGGGALYSSVTTGSYTRLPGEGGSGYQGVVYIACPV